MEIEFSAELQDYLDEGSILTLGEVEIRYNHMMQNHGIPHHHITCAVGLLTNKIEQQK